MQRRTRECSFRQGLFGSDLNVHSIETLRELMITRRPKRYRPLVALLRSGLRHRVMIVADGEEWQRTRDAVNPALQAGVVATDYAPVIQEVAEQAFSRLANRAGDPAGTTWFDIPVEPLMRTVTLSVLGHLLFGRVLPLEEASLMEGTLTTSTEGKVEGPAAWINKGLGTIFAAFDAGEYQPMIFSRKQRRATDQILAWIGNRIEEVKRAGLRPPLLEQLEVRYASQRPARRKRSIVAEYAMICVAAIETTARPHHQPGLPAYYLISLRASLNLGCSLVRNHSKATISDVTISAPADFARSIAAILLALWRDPIASTTSRTR